MRYLLLFYFFIVSLVCHAQVDSLPSVEPGRETSFKNYEVLFIAVLGLVLLIGLRFWFKRTRKH